ncbi:MAG TPA: hypothetical protein VJV76_03620 [Gaiellaceae bacterium]|nr:hypothetical protein [Gaiellaceae bacterium]
MNDFDDKCYRGKGGNLGSALEHAWDNAKAEGAPAGTYKVEIAIEAENPIRGYIVKLTPDE